MNGPRMQITYNEDDTYRTQLSLTARYRPIELLMKKLLSQYIGAKCDITIQREIMRDTDLLVRRDISQITHYIQQEM